MAECKIYLQNESMSDIKLHKKVTNFLMLFGFLFYFANAQENSSDDYWNPQIASLDGYKSSFLVALLPEEANKMKVLWKEIGEDLKTDKNEFSSTYISLGYGSGYFLRWSVNKGFILIPYWDQSLISEFSYGKVKVENDSEIKFIAEKDLKSKYSRFKKTPRIWIPAVNSKYLIPKEQIKWFGDYYGGFGDFNGFPRKTGCGEGSFFARRIEKDTDKNQIKLLAPAKYLKLIKQPIESEIIFVGKRRIVLSSFASGCGFAEKNSATFVVINKGHKHNITKGLLFLLDEGERSSDEVLKITKVDENSSEGIVYRFVDKNGKDIYDKTYNEELKEHVGIPSPPLKKGIKVATSFRE